MNRVSTPSGEHLELKGLDVVYTYAHTKREETWPDAASAEERFANWSRAILRRNGLVVQAPANDTRRAEGCLP